MTSQLFYRSAQHGDLPRLIELLADDELGNQREALQPPWPKAYSEAMQAIDNDPNNELIVALIQKRLVAMLQLTFLPSLTYRGRWRAQIEGVRVAADQRGNGIGQAIVAEAIERARQRACHLVQLTTDKQRPQALRF